MATLEVLHAHVEEKAQIDVPAVGQHHDKARQLPPGPADHEVPKAPPVTLGAFSGQHPQPQVGLGPAREAMAPDQAAEVALRSGKSPLAHHGVEARRPERRVVLQCL